MYSFLLQIIPFKDVDLHKLYLFLDLLLRKTKLGPGGGGIKLTDEVQLKYYKIEQTFNGDASVHEGDTLPGGGGGEAGRKEEEEEELSVIIERINKRFGVNLTQADWIVTEQLGEDFAGDEELVQKAKNNPIADFRYAFEHSFLDKVVRRMDQNEAFCTRILDDEDFRAVVVDYMLMKTYKRLRESVG
ncbi:MAG TPA: hypothetical protein DG577_08845 [Firmicutes bacterium]|jgi:type I restriction enzyme R subunit|nr:hypothetical protein [Bacillota bacterium]